MPNADVWRDWTSDPWSGKVYDNVDDKGSEVSTTRDYKRRMATLPYGLEDESEDYRRGYNAGLEHAARRLVRAKFIAAAAELVLSLRHTPKGEKAGENE